MYLYRRKKILVLDDFFFQTQYFNKLFMIFELMINFYKITYLDNSYIFVVLTWVGESGASGECGERSKVRTRTIKRIGRL